MPGYQCVFFDLDHTLWDYETNCSETLSAMYHHYELEHLGVPSFPEFLKSFVSVNNALWDQYDRGLIQHEAIRYDRFHRILKEVGVDDYDMSLKMSKHYMTESPKGKNLMPQAIETLDYLVANYPLYIITNGFSEIQSVKLASSGLEKYFKKVITSEQAGHKKPAREIFDFALNQIGFHSHQAIMIGDNLTTDIGGARNAEIDHVFFNPSKVLHAELVTYEISGLEELKDIL